MFKNTRDFKPLSSDTDSDCSMESNLSSHLKTTQLCSLLSPYHMKLTMASLDEQGTTPGGGHVSQMVQKTSFLPLFSLLNTMFVYITAFK